MGDWEIEVYTTIEYLMSDGVYGVSIGEEPPIQATVNVEITEIDWSDVTLHINVD